MEEKTVLQTALNGFIANFPVSEDVKQEMQERLNGGEAGTSEYITAEQAAQIAHVKAQTVKRWIRAGKLHPVNKGRKYLIERKELIERRAGI